MHLRNQDEIIGIVYFKRERKRIFIRPHWNSGPKVKSIRYQTKIQSVDIRKKQFATVKELPNHIKKFSSSLTQHFDSKVWLSFCLKLRTNHLHHPSQNIKIIKRGSVQKNVRLNGLSKRTIKNEGCSIVTGNKFVA